jgi:hypothetical protein
MLRTGRHDLRARNHPVLERSPLARIDDGLGAGPDRSAATHNYDGPSSEMKALLDGSQETIAGTKSPNCSNPNRQPYHEQSKLFSSAQTAAVE